MHGQRRRVQPRPRRRPQLAAAIAVTAMLLSACASDEPSEADPAATQQDGVDELAVAVASFDLHEGVDRRLLLGVMSADRGLVALGEVAVEVGPLVAGTEGFEPSQTATARFLPVPGAEPETESAAPVVLAGEPGAGGVRDPRGSRRVRPVGRPGRRRVR